MRKIKLLVIALGFLAALPAVVLWNSSSAAPRNEGGIVQQQQQQIDSLVQGSSQIIGVNLSLPPDLAGTRLTVLPMVSFLWHADGTLSDVVIRRTAPFVSPIPVRKFEAIEDALRAAVIKSAPLRRVPPLSSGTYNCVATYNPGNSFPVSLQLDELPIEETQANLIKIPGEVQMPVPPGVLLGFIDSRGNTAVKPQFMQARSYRNEMAAVRGATGWGAIDKTGAVKIPLVYSYIGDLNDGRVPVQRRGLSGFLDGAGQIVVEPNYSQCGRFSDGLAPVQIGQNWGYVDTTGNLAIRPQFDAASAFASSVAAVRNPPGVTSGEGPEGYIDKSGRFVIPPSFAIALDFEDGMATVASHDFKFYAITATGAPAFRPGLLAPWERFHEGLARTLVGTKVGYIDTRGNAVVPPKFDYDEGTFPYTGWFSEGLAAVKVGDRYGFIDKTGRTVISPRFAFAGPFHDRLAPACVDKAFGYIDHQGKFVVQPSFAIAYPFSDGRALVGLKAGKAH